MDTQAKIKETVTGNPVVLYMKGSPKFPQCGFSNLAMYDSGELQTLLAGAK